MYCPDCGAGINVPSRTCKLEIVSIRDRSALGLPSVASVIVTDHKTGHDVNRFTISPAPASVGERVFVEACLIHGVPRLAAQNASWNF
jgi:hypothetical protein